MTRLSNRQYPMLGAFIHGGPNYHMTIHEAQKFDQRPFRSMLIQEWIAFRPGRGFHITREGRMAWIEFHETDIHRHNPALPLTAYFDPTAYGLAPAKPHKATHRATERKAPRPASSVRAARESGLFKVAG